MVAPIGVQNPQLSLGRVTMFFFEIIDNFSKVVCVHRKSPILAESSILSLLHFRKPGELRQRLDFRFFACRESGKVFFTRFDGIDIIMPD